MSVLCGLATCVFTFKLRLHLSGPFDLIKKNSQTCVIIVSLFLSCEGCLWLEASQGNFFHTGKYKIRVKQCHAM